MANVECRTREAHPYVLLLALAVAAEVGMFAASKPSPSLPRPATRGKRSVEEVLAARRSVREFADAALSEQETAQLCWAAQGVTEFKQCFRMVPAATARHGRLIDRADATCHLSRPAARPR